MKDWHLELLVEEPSMEAFLSQLLPRTLPSGHTFRIHSFRGKADLLRKLPARLQGYRHWLPKEIRIIVLVDRDNDDCHSLKARLENEAAAAGLVTRTEAVDRTWQVVNRIVWPTRSCLRTAQSCLRLLGASS